MTTDQIRERLSNTDLSKLSPEAQELLNDPAFIEATGVLITTMTPSDIPSNENKESLLNKMKPWLSSVVLIIGSVLVYDELRHPVQATIREFGQTRLVADVGATLLNAIGVGLIVGSVFYVSRKKER